MNRIYDMIFQWLPVLLALIIIFTVIGFVMAFNHTKNSFTDVCNKVNGTTVYDGRQYQCIKKND